MFHKKLVRTALFFAMAVFVIASNALNAPAMKAQSTAIPVEVQPLNESLRVKLGQDSFIPKALKLVTETDMDAVRGIVCKPGDNLSEEGEGGCDERIPVSERNYPWSTIGRLQIGLSGHCTATLVGEDIILTNAHCIIDDETHEVRPEKIVFLPNLVNGVLRREKDAATIVHAFVGTDFSGEPYEAVSQDWAILQIDKPLGQRYGWLNWKALSPELLAGNPDKFTLVGYSGDFPDPKKYEHFQAGRGLTPGMHDQCSVFDYVPDARVLVHDCDTTGGASGAPIIGWLDNLPYILALHRGGEYNIDTARSLGTHNYAVEVARLDEWMAAQSES